MARINSNTKGKVGELEFANLCKTYGFNTRRSVQYSGINIDSDADVIGLPNIYIEVKRVEAINVDKVMDRLREDNKTDDMGILAHRKNNKGWLVTMDFTDWMEIYKRYLTTTI